jgi:hypothetical protein
VAGRDPGRVIGAQSAAGLVRAPGVAAVTAVRATTEPVPREADRRPIGVRAGAATRIGRGGTIDRSRGATIGQDRRVMRSHDVRASAALDSATTPTGVHAVARRRFEVAAARDPAEEAAAATGASDVRPATKAAIARDRRTAAADRDPSALGSTVTHLHHHATAPTTAAGAARIVTAIEAGRAARAGRAAAGREGSMHPARDARVTVRGALSARGHFRRATAGRGGRSTATAARSSRAEDVPTRVSGGVVVPVPVPPAPSKQRWPICSRPTRRSSRGGAR